MDVNYVFHDSSTFFNNSRMSGLFIAVLAFLKKNPYFLPNFGALLLSIEVLGVPEFNLPF